MQAVRKVICDGTSPHVYRCEECKNMCMNHALLPHRVASTPTTSWHLFCEGNEDMAIDSNRSLSLHLPLLQPLIVARGNN